MVISALRSVVYQCFGVLEQHPASPSTYVRFDSKTFATAWCIGDISLFMNHKGAMRERRDDRQTV